MNQITVADQMEHPVPIVIDASVAIAYVRQEPETPTVRAAIADWTHAARPLLVPAMFWYEVVNPLARQHGYSGDSLIAVVEELEALEITTVEPDRTLLLFAIDHLERFGLTAYDAAYLALATIHGAALATLDGRLAAAAGDRGLFLGIGRRMHETPAVYEHDVTWPNYKGAARYLASLRTD